MYICSIVKHKFKYIAMTDKLLKFIEPYLSYIDSGKLYRKPFSWFYILWAVFNAILPFYMLYKAIDSGIFKYMQAKHIFAFVLIWLVVLAACWVGFQIWWNRKDKVLETSEEGSEFPATPVIAHFFQTFGEWLGTFIAIVGFGASLIATIFLGNDAGSMGNAMGLHINLGITGIISFPILGFVIIVGMRFLAELCRALASIANNTKKA